MIKVKKGLVIILLTTSLLYILPMFKDAESI